MVSTAQPKLTIATWSEKFISSRIDLDKNTTRNYKTALKKVGETFGHRDPVTITVDEVAGWVATLGGDDEARERSSSTCSRSGC